MTNFEYKVIPAPRKAEKAKGVRGTEARFAHTITNAINTLSSEGWEYFRAESLPVDEKPSMMGKPVEKLQSLLIFRRETAEVPEATTYTPTAPSEKTIDDPSMLAALGEEDSPETIAVGAAVRD